MGKFIFTTTAVPWMGKILCLEWWMGKFDRPYFSTLRDLHFLKKRENFTISCVSTCYFGKDNIAYIKILCKEIYSKPVHISVNIIIRKINFLELFCWHMCALKDTNRFVLMCRIQWWKENFGIFGWFLVEKVISCSWFLVNFSSNYPIVARKYEM